MKLRGSAGVDVDALMAKSKELTRAYQEGKAKIEARRSGDPWMVDAPPVKTAGPVHPEVMLLQRLLDDPQSGIDKSKLPNLRKATAAEVDAALQAFQLIDSFEFNLGKLLETFQFVASLASSERASSGQIDLGVRHGHTALSKVEWIKKALKAAGPSAAVANFPVAALDALEANLKADLGVLEKELPHLKFAPLAPGTSSSGWGAPKDPSPTHLPKPVHLTRKQLTTPDELARAISARLKRPELAASILDAIQANGGGEGPLAKQLVDFALLVDEAVTAPNYRQSWGGGMDRSVYRARQHAMPSCLGRQQNSRALLSQSLSEALAAKDPTAALEAKLVSEFLREVGLDPKEILGWRPRPEAIAAALDAEALLPMRAFVERGASATYYLPVPHTHAVVLEAVQSIVEGRYAEWRLSNAGSKEQLSILDGAQLEAFQRRTSVSFELKTADNQKVELKTRELGGESLELFWATKCGGPSHGFDVSVTCSLSVVVNARNTIIVVDDPRWPQPAARTYLRLVSRPETGQPVLFLEGPALDFPYPRHLMLDLEKAIIRHGIEKAKAMGVPLAISGSISRAVQELKLPVKTHAPCAQPYKLGASLLLEAASVFGSHDWPQLKAEVRPVVKTHHVLENPE